MTTEELDSLYSRLSIYNFPPCTDERIEEKIKKVEAYLGFKLATSYVFCMRLYSEVESSYRHLLEVDKIKTFTELEKEENAIPFGYYVLEYLDDITMLQNSAGEIFISTGAKPKKYCNNLEEYLSQSWNDDLAQKIENNMLFEKCGANLLIEIEEVENTLGIQFEAQFREYLSTYSYVGNGERRLLNLLECAEQTMKKRQESANFPRDWYVIENFENNLTFVVQNTMGFIYELGIYKEQEAKGLSLAEFLVSDF